MHSPKSKDNIDIVAYPSGCFKKYLIQFCINYICASKSSIVIDLLDHAKEKVTERSEGKENKKNEKNDKADSIKLNNKTSPEKQRAHTTRSSNVTVAKPLSIHYANLQVSIKKSIPWRYFI
jgi:hypothetical protein